MANLPFLPEQGESLDLKSGRFRSQKTGRYTRRVDLEVIVAAIKDTLKSVVSIDQKMTELVKSAELINTNIVSLGDLVNPRSKRQKPPVDAAQEKREAISSVKEKTKKAGFSIMGLVALIALLKNDKLMAIVKGFFTGFLEGLGFGKEAIEKIKFWVGFAVNAFKVYLGFKVFKQVYDAFMAMKRLGELMGILGQKTQTESGLVAQREVVARTKETLAQRATKMKDAFKAAAEKAQARVKSITKVLTNKNELIKLKNKAIASTKATLTKSINTIKQKFSNFKKLIMNGIKLIRSAVKITTLAASLPSFGLSLLIGAAVDAVLMTALDYFMADEGAKPDGAGMLGNLAKNFVESITFGFVKGDKLKEMVIAGAKKLFSWFQKAWDWFGSSDKKTESTKSMGAKVEAKTSPAVGQATLSSKEVGVSGLPGVQQAGKPNAVPGAASSSSMSSATSTGSSAGAAAGSSGMSSATSTGSSSRSSSSGNVSSAQLEPSTSLSEVGISSLSERVTMDKKLAMQSAAMNNQVIVNNSNVTNVMGNAQTPNAKTPSMVIYSDTVGF
jgi:hypothetical protein